MNVNVHIPRPDDVDLVRQGRRGPFAPLLMALETMTAINVWLMRQGDYPPLYESGIVYQNEPPGVEELVPYNEMLVRGWGDCGHIAPVRAAELRLAGLSEAKCCIRWKWVRVRGVRHPVLLVHVLVQWPDGTIEDPCRVLGMEGDY